MRCAVTVCLIAALLVSVSHANCPLIGGFDLNSVPTLSQTIPQLYNGGTSNHNWVVNLCNPVSQPYAPATACKGPGFISEYNSNSCESYWDVFSGSSTDSGIVLTYTQSADTRVSQVTLSCGTQLALTPVGNVQVTGPTTKLNFAFQFTTSAVCGGPVTPAPATPAPIITPAPAVTPAPIITPAPVITPAPIITPAPVITPAPSGSPTGGNGGGGNDNPACSGGCAFTIIIFVGLAVYVIGMVLFYYFYRGYRGLDLIPHKWFWKEIPFLFKDGVVFSVNKIRALACKSGPLYEADGSYQQM